MQVWNQHNIDILTIWCVQNYIFLFNLPRIKVLCPIVI